MKDTNKPHAQHPLKTQAKILNMIANQDSDGLHMISQQNVENAMWKIFFGFHNSQGIHGACPMEMLHAMLLGVFKYIRDCFFNQIGAGSNLADNINPIARIMGEILGRQSQRDLPRTRFPNGIMKGKLNAKDFPGILLCIACVLQCRGSCQELQKRHGHFRQQGVLNDWPTVIETLLQWEMWLKADRLHVKHVERARKKTDI